MSLIHLIARNSRRKARRTFPWVASVCLLLVGASGLWAADPPTDPNRGRTLPKTNGVNYEFADPVAHPEYVTATPLSFSADVEIGPSKMKVRMASDPGDVLSACSCSGPCNSKRNLTSGDAKEAAGQHHHYRNCTISGGAAECQIHIVRFSQFGRVSGPVPLDWSVTMVDGEEVLGGTMKAAVDKDSLIVYPAQVELKGRMVITVRMAGQKELIRLRSHKEPIFRGSIPDWPPAGGALELINPPIEYFREEDLAKDGAVPFLSILTNTVHLNQGQNAFLQQRPHLVKIEPAKEGGFTLRWTSDTSRAVAARIARFHIYRNRTPGRLEGWERIATVPASARSFVDRDVARGETVEYVVSHAADDPLGGEYEGIFEEPMRAPQ